MGNNWLSKYIKRYLFGDISDDEVKKRLYDNMTPHNYHFYDGESAIKRIKDAIKRNESEFDKMPVDYRHYSEYRDDIYAEYLGIPKNRRHNIENKTIVSDADYFPTIGSAENLKKINLTDLDIKTLVNSGILLKHGENKVDNSLGYYFADHTVGRGFDNNGDYISYYDKWDVNPYKGKYAHLVGTMGFVPKKVKSVEDLSFGVGNPTEYYDRVYLDDYYDIPEEARGNPFITPAVVTAYKKGGRIHIKKKNRGKFTEYCGGKVTEECIAKGKKSKDPKIRKRATFAANVRRWKHENGGILKAQEGTGNGFWSKLWNAVKEGGMAARDAKLGAVGAQQVRDLYSEGKNQEAQNLAKQYAKANTTGIALAGGAASTGLLGDLMVTGATTAADTFIDGDTENFGSNLVKNAAGDLIGHGAFGALKNVNFGDILAKIKHPTWKKYYHGSPEEFDIKNFYKGTVADSGLHMSDRREVAEYFAGANWFNAQKPTVYEFYAPKPTMEFMDLHGNGVNMLSGNTKRISGNVLGKGTFDGTPYSQLEYKALRENGGEDVIDFLTPYTNDRYGSIVQPFQLKRDVVIPIEKYHWPNRPKHVDDRLKEMRRQYDLAIESGDDATRVKLNSEVSDIMAENGIPVVKYANNNAFEGGGMSYMLFDRSKLHLINPDHQFDIMRPTVTTIGTGLGAGYGVSQVKDE